MSELVEIGQVFGGDVELAASGDWLTVSGSTMTQQLLLRRLLTNPGDYLAHPEYGAGLPGLVGSVFEVAQVETIIASQLRLEAGVAQSPPPQVVVTPFAAGMTVVVRYTDAATGAPSVLGFSVTE